MKKILLCLLCGIAFQLYAQDSLSLTPKDDSFVRGGTFEKDNYGANDRFRVKKEDNLDYTRVSYLKFDLTNLTIPLKNASLKLTTISQGATWNGNVLIAQKCSNNNWNEASLDFTNAPTLDEEQVNIIASTGKNVLDISSLVQQALTKDSILTIAITKLKGGTDDWCDFASKEHTDANKHPQLTINGTTNTITTSLISPSENQIDWSLAGYQGEIPTYQYVIDVTTMGIKNDGTTDNADVLNQLIQNSVAGTVLSFPAGEYFFSETINLKDSIVLRGNCPSTTTFNFDFNGDASPSVWFKGNASSNFTSMLSDGLKNSTKISVENSADFKEGEFIEITQENDASKMYTKDDWDVSWAYDVVGQVAQIEAIHGNEITLKTPLLYTFTTALNAKAQPFEAIQGAGIENVKINRIDDGNDYSLRFAFAHNSWIRNIESDFADRGHVEISKSSNIEVRDSYFHHAHDYGGGGHGYGVNFQDHATLCLIENNIFHYLRHTFLAKEGAIGNVFAYNYSINPNGSANDIALHGHYGLMNLLEGNIVQKIIAGDYWGPSGPGNTYFRNRVETSDIVMDDYTHSQNIIANEILNGTVDISSEITGTWQHYNFNSNGLIDLEYTVEIPASLYYTQQPDFLKGYNWPIIDPQHNFGQSDLPAKDRWNTEEKVTCLTFDIITSLTTIKTQTLQVYPTPTSSSVTIDFPEITQGEITLFNHLGQQVLSKNIHGQQIQLSLDQLPNGIYIGVINQYHFTIEVNK